MRTLLFITDEQQYYAFYEGLQLWMPFYDDVEEEDDEILTFATLADFHAWEANEVW